MRLWALAGPGEGSRKGGVSKAGEGKLPGSKPGHCAGCAVPVVALSWCLAPGTGLPTAAVQLSGLGWAVLQAHVTCSSSCIVVIEVPSIYYAVLWRLRFTRTSINQSINYTFPAWCWVCVQGDPVSCFSMILYPELIAPSSAAASDSLNPPSHSPSSTWAACPCWPCLGVGCASAFVGVWYPPVLPHGQATSAF